MNKETVSTALSQIDNAYIEEYFDTKDSLSREKLKRIKRRRAAFTAAAVACAAIICVATVSVVRDADDRIPEGVENTAWLENELLSSSLPDDSAVAGWVTSDISDGIRPPEYTYDEESAEKSDITFFESDIKNSTIVYGSAVGYSGNLGSSPTQNAPPSFEFNRDGVAVTARVVEELPNIYQSLNEYGLAVTKKYRVFKMQTTSSLESSMPKEFYYALPSELKGDLAKYDTLLLSLTTQGKNYVLKNTTENKLEAFESLYTAPNDEAEFGNVIAFSNGVFDEELWKDKSWRNGYQFARLYLENGENEEALLVRRGSTLAEALQILGNNDIDYSFGTLYFKHHQTDEVSKALEYVKPFENGVFVPSRNGYDIIYRRYIGGCPTNEWISVNIKNNTVKKSKESFNDGDFESLPDITDYIGKMNISDYSPQHTDTAEKKLLYNYATGWYEKTANGVCSVVKIAWCYTDEGYNYKYYDESFVLLTSDGAKNISKDELIKLIGPNIYISCVEYGVPVEMPRE